MNTPQTVLNDDLPDEIDFSGGTRGQFYQPGLILNLPIYLEAEVQAYLSRIASKKGVGLSELANDLLKKDLQIFEVMNS